MLLGLLDILKREGHDVDALVYSYYPQRDAELAALLPGVSVRKGHPRDLAVLIPLLILNRLFGFALPNFLRAPYRELAERDVICLLGGTTFADSMLYKVPWNLLAALPALLVARPFVFLSQTLGPFRRRLNVWPARWVLSRATAVHGRGHRSVELVESLGVKGARYWPDLSFGMDLGEAAHAPRLRPWLEKLDTFGAGASDRLVGLTPNTIVESKMREAGMNYAALMAATVVELDARGYRPVLVPHSYQAGAKRGHNNDVHLCREIIRLLPADTKHLFIDEDLSSQELRLLIGRFRFLIASRFHSMISALAMGVPPITLGWGDQKYIEVLEAFGVPELYLDYTEGELNGLRQKIDWLEKNREAITMRMKEGLREAESLNAGLASVLLGGSPAGH
jgi:polysaccharide pyruvyl transferase WcaK-like protein